MPKKIVITGATGLIGSRIFNALVQRGEEVTVFTRSPEKAIKEIPGAKEYVKWNAEESGSWEKSISNKDAVIHLAGASLAGKRWTEEYKKEIIKSRVISTQGIVNALGKSANRPEVFICASAIGYYGTSEDKEFTENALPGKDFVSGVCTSWEREAATVEQYGVRRVSIRTGLVLDKNEGALAKMLLPFRLFFGGPLGKGNQWMSWIHVDDITGIYLRALDDKAISGPINATAPNPVRMVEFASNIGSVINKPSWIRVPDFILKAALGEMADMVIKGQKVLPKKILENGYNFKFSFLDSALSGLLK